MTEQEKIAYDCRKATFLIEKKALEKITAKESLALSFHLTGCFACRLYEKQSLFINNLAGILFKNKTGTFRLTDSEKSHLQEVLSKHLH